MFVRAVPFCDVQARATASFGRQPQATVHRTSRSRKPGRIRPAELGIRRELLYGWPWSSVEPGDPGSSRTARQDMPSQSVHDTRGRGTWALCAEIRRHTLHLVLRGRVNCKPCTYKE